ncbi:fatty acid desaturase [Streptomyces virginiae]|uniref:fatty acid desaturase n=1 Tax=Streptomyces virginiae TaxID=1961 RepID=UPI00386A1174|nr:fatty acid desaturase [Streptomyces virginiae]
MNSSETVRPPPVRADAGSDFARLSRKIQEAGLMARRPRYYALRIAAVTALYAAGWTAFVLIGDSWWTLLVAGFLAFVFGQVALLAHDVAHRQVFRLRKGREVSGRVAGNLGIGMGYGWWQDKHTRHHANPNHEDLDPDLDPDIFVWTQDQARAARGLPRLLGRSQAFLFFPLLTLEGFNLHVSGVRSLFDRSLKHRMWEGALLTAHLAAYLGALFLVLPPGKAVVFLLVHQCLFGVCLGSIFAPNHKGMPILTGAERPEAFLQHEDAEIILSFPGLGAQLGARVLAELGDDRGRFADARGLKAYAGSSPITRASGKKSSIARRRIKNDRLNHAGYLWAFSALRASPGAMARYRHRRDERGDWHASALRNVFNNLIGQLHHCLQHRKLFDEQTAFSTTAEQAPQAA